jgi:O-antigen ligase
MDALDRFIQALHRRRLLGPLAALLFLGYAWYWVHEMEVLPILVPGAVLGLVLLAWADLRYIWALGLALMPLSLNLGEESNVAITIPSDLIAIGLMFTVMVKGRSTGELLARVWRHPVFRALGLMWLWMLISIIPSEMPVVSLKYFLNTTWYLFGFFVFSLHVFATDVEWTRKWLFITILPLLGALGYTLTRHALEGFSFLASYRVMSPIFREHTVYAACVAIYAVAYPLLTLGQQRGTRKWALALAMSGLLAIAAVLSYTRGAWLGIIVAGGLWFCVKYWQRLKFLIVTGSVVVLAGFVILFSQDLSDKQSNAEERGFGQHFQTAFDVKRNTSNQERLNRWVAALGMVEERPFFGFGPGTFAFQYARFQQTQYKTYVSTNQGEIGTAHNEFLLAISEMGWVAGFLFLFMVAAATYRGLRGYARAKHPVRRNAYAIAVCSLLTYFAHSFVNNFLDQDKMAMPIYVCLAIIVALDCLHPETPEGELRPLLPV